MLPETGSTNAVAAEEARAGDAHGLVVAAEHQTSGRGRLARSWESPPRAGLTVTVAVRPDVAAADWGWLPLLTGLAVLDTVRAAAPGLSAGLKWPNDVVVEDRKLAGLLVERIDGPAGPTAILGIGLNVSLTADERPVPQATSLLLEGVDPVPDRSALLAALLEALGRRLSQWVHAAEDLAADYRAACRTLGQEVRVDLPDGGVLTGVAVDLESDGALVVESEGRRQTVRAGDVVHVRPQG